MGQRRELLISEPAPDKVTFIPSLLYGTQVKQHEAVGSSGVRSSRNKSHLKSLQKRLADGERGKQGNLFY